MPSRADIHPARGTTIEDLQTPVLLLDRDKLDHNIARLAGRVAAKGVALRPHLKSAKSRAVAKRIFSGKSGPITVSTLAEAEYFAAAGFRDITYAVGIAPHNVLRALPLLKAGVCLNFLLDSKEQVIFLGRMCRAAGLLPTAFIEIDCDGHRGGVAPSSDMLCEIGAEMIGRGVQLSGVLTHAGESYKLNTPADLTAAAEGERAAAVAAATKLRDAGYECREVSIGSTPTALSAENLSGVTEIRAGVYMFFDLVMHGIGICSTDDIAISVLSTVIGRNSEKGWILIDAGWMALSRDRGTASQQIDQGYGVVCDLSGRPYPNLLVSQVSQEHGILSMRPGAEAVLPDLRIGSKVRILPNHACATAAQHDRYHVISDKNEEIEARWERIRGW